MPSAGQIGKYELEEFLGGGMSHVYKARDTVLGRTVAVKILTENACTQPEAKARFLAEARMASSLTHDNVLSIYDFGEDDQQRPFMVMEFLRGQDLRDTIRDGRTGDLASKLRIALQIGRALEYIHTQKVIHRDIKPENIHITAAGVAKLMDFGIAKTEGLSMTRTGFVLGTPYYMAPEQVNGKDVTEQVDVYSFGVLLFELMSGAKPITGDTVERIFYLILNEPLDLAPLQASGAPPAICDLVARCTAKNPAERPHGFAPVCAELERLIGTGPHPIVPQAGGAAAAPALEPKPVTVETPAPRRRPRLVLWGGFAAGALMLGIAFGLAWTGYRQLDLQTRAAADAVSGAGIGADGLITPEALRQFEILRKNLDTIDGYHRHGGPPGYRLGMLLWGDMYARARTLYFERFRTFFLGPLQNNMLQFLRGLPASQGPPYGTAYETLKAYLSTTAEPEKSDPSFVAPVMLRWWGSGLNVGPAREAAAQREFRFYAQELLQDDPFPRDYDKEAVAKARRYLSQFPPVDRLYAFLTADAAQHTPALNFNPDQKVLTAPYQVPGQFTRAGWEFFDKSLAAGDAYFAADTWVVGDNVWAGSDHAQLARDLSARYRADFAKVWREYLHSAAVVRFASVTDAAQKLAELSSDNSPLVEWLYLAAKNTAVKDDAVAGSFQPVQSAAAASSRYRDALAALGSALQIGGAPANEVLVAANQTVKQIEAGFHADAEGHLEVQVSRMLDEPVSLAAMVLRPPVASPKTAVLAPSTRR